MPCFLPFFAKKLSFLRRMAFLPAILSGNLSRIRRLRRLKKPRRAFQRFSTFERLSAFS